MAGARFQAGHALDLQRLEHETDGDADTKAAMRRAWANRRNWPDSMRRKVASLYATEPDTWDRVTDFIAAAV